MTRGWHPDRERAFLELHRRIEIEYARLLALAARKDAEKA